MSARIVNLVILLFVTLFSIGLVEGGYFALNSFVFNKKKTSQKRVVAKQQEFVEQSLPRRDYQIIVTRNLFASGAKDPVETELADDLEELRASELDLVLMGTVGGDARYRRAFILDRKSRKQEIYEIGDEVHGATIQKILRGKVVINHQGENEILDMAEAASMRKSYAARVPLPKKPPPKPGEISQANGAPRTPVAVARRKVVRNRVRNAAGDGEEERARDAQDE